MLEKIRKNLSSEPSKKTGPSNLTLAAVLLPLLVKDSELHILLTKRTQTVKVHKGQISFPGGVHNTGDQSLLATALREAHEEIGLNQRDVDVFGPLEPISTVTSGFLVHTYVGLIPYPYPFKPDSREVAEVLIIPFHYLANEAHWSLRSYHATRNPFEAYFVSYENHLIWGATARILKIFFEKNGFQMNIRSAMET
jgi:8-oxo-dGTP pyrophosphatase MutT (NUDIX family)